MLEHASLRKASSLAELTGHQGDAEWVVSPEQTAQIKTPRQFGLTADGSDFLSLGGPPAAIPHGWINDAAFEVTLPEIKLSVLHGALVFGGRITERAHLTHA